MTQIQYEQRQTYAEGTAEIVDESRHRVIANVENLDPNNPALMVFARPWFPGYRARLNGVALEVKKANLILPAVEIPPNTRGELTLMYLPKSVVRGAMIAAIAAITTIAIGAWCVFAPKKLL